ncbi:MAG TPA: aspartyl protease family protein [Dehalococcoidia bacterium]|nr:aspartyl protease family protein [Dehalococcoidia bacterium]
MGTFRVEIEVGDPEGSRFESIEALVDTGATNTALPAPLRSSLGVTPYTRTVFELADGRDIELEVGRTWVRVDGQQEFTQVVFSTADAEPILGAITLEEMGLAVDPVSRRLLPVRKYLMRLRQP